MKAVVLTRIALSFFLAASPVMLTSAWAQADKSEKKAQVRIQVSEDQDGKTKNIDKTYEVGSMSDKERDAFIDKVLDSLGVEKNKKQRISITFDDGDRQFSQRKKKTIMDHRDDRDVLAFNYEWDDDLAKTFSYNADKFRQQYRNFERDFTPKAKIFMKDMENFGDKMAESWEKDAMKPASVRALSIYPNNPDNGVLNVRFSVPAKGDVTISVTDVKGKEVGKREIKDFSGEFVGQVELKKNIKGTVFVSVVQNEDGTVKRVVIP
ncbi:T9SS type A sorting domain-containing protein [Dyadobacter sandarakinus]|uniref:T9SS type A sorting domain-containing protein n=1 Tax=Dyadobacter sandarakinus TaxID=2747268 RepID=A0ABX7IBQ5_9BACT|nr:T9SS type A sorting domain-containing protein [Dyadobacter sandarakinus]QRR02568.1 T9SS type A sorting domain-containing protein [Dyadobacter sandarakinus]